MATVSRLSAVESAAVHPSAVCVLHCRRKCHQCPASTLQRHQFSVCRPFGAPYVVVFSPLVGKCGYIPACIWCAVSSAAGQRQPPAVHLSAVESGGVCVLLAGGSAINAHLTPSGGISAAFAVHLVRRIISSRSEVSRLPAVESAAVHPSAVCVRHCRRKCRQCPANAL